MKFASVMAGALAALLAQQVMAQQTLLLRQPDISAEHLAFVYAGDIWVTARDGSNPRRLTSHPAEENQPVFSPDGRMIAFAASYENNQDVYVVNVAGGQPQRLTWHPGDDSPTGWTADGRAITMVSARETDHGRSGQLYHVSIDGGLPGKRMEARVMDGVYDSRGNRFAYISFRAAYNGLTGGTSGWRGYRGGSAPAVQIFDIEAQSVTSVPGANANNINPMWLGDTLYFLSDRIDKTLNVHRYDAINGSVTKVSAENVWDIRAAGAHGTNIVYEAGGRLKEIDTTTGDTREIVISIRPDLSQRRPQWKDASKAIDAIGISATGKRAIVTARGEVFTVPVDEGPTRNVTNSGSVREYSAIWSPQGDQVAYLTDSLSGQNLVVSEQTGTAAKRSYPLGAGFYDLMGWSVGDNPRIIFSDNHLRLLAIDLGSGAIDEIASGSRRDQVDASLSPDGNWLAYTLEKPNYYRDLVLLNFATGDRTVLSDGTADVASPAFSKDGKYLYFAASTNSGPLQVGLNMTSQERPYRAGLYAIVLAADGKSPLLPASGDEGDDDEAGKEDNESESDPKKSIVPTRIDLQGLIARTVALPVAERNYSNLGVADDGNLYYVQGIQPGASVEVPGVDAEDANELMRFVLADREAQHVMTGVEGFSLSADGKQMIIGNVDGSLAVAEIGDEMEAEPLDLSGVRIRVDPRDEWAMIFDETWRMEREYFYDPNMHGLDWQAIYDRYRPLVDHVGRREDLTALLVEMIAEMQVGHNRSGGGDTHREEGTNTGLLGANLRINDGRYQLARVYSGESWNPFIEAPLATPGNAALAGEYILAINGRELLSTDNIFEYLQGTSGTQVTLTVGPDTNGRNARDIVVEPVDDERSLRLWAWVENNRRAVDAATDGRVGYIYLPNTADAGFTFFNRMFFAQLDKDGMIIDERSNGGGQAANYITDVLSRRHLSGWKDRDGMVYNTPAGAMHGPKVMLIDQDAGSGGDFLPYSFRQLGIGKLIGTRTWGGLIGIAANPQLVDGGGLTVPFFRFYDANDQWTVENQGVAPDIEVMLDPVATNQGRDTQLEAAIAEVMDQLEDFRSPIPSGAPPMPTELGQ